MLIFSGIRGRKTTTPVRRSEVAKEILGVAKKLGDASLQYYQ
jgi:hypothetical protein